MKDLKILLVDDEKAFRHGMEAFLMSQGYIHINTASNGDEALEIMRNDPPDIVLLDLFMPGKNGLQVLKEMHEIKKDLPILVVTCEADEEYKHITLLLGAYDYLTKPLALSHLFKRMEAHLAERYGPPKPV